MYATMRSFALPLPIFMIVTSAQQQSVQIPHTEFYPNWTVNVESTDAKTCANLRKVCLSRHWFSRNSQTHWIFMEMISSKFCINCLKNVEITGNISLLSLSSVCLSVCRFSLNMLDELLLVRTSNTEFHENLTTSVVADTMLETDGQTGMVSI